MAGRYAVLDGYNYSVDEDYDLVNIRIKLRSVMDQTITNISNEVTDSDGLIYLNGRKLQMLTMDVKSRQDEHVLVIKTRNLGVL